MLRKLSGSNKILIIVWQFLKIKKTIELEITSENENNQWRIQSHDYGVS